MKTTRAQRDRIAELRERGWSMPRIAKAVGTTKSAVSHWCLVEAVEPTTLPSPYVRRVGPVLRAGKMIYPFTLDEDRLLIEWDKQGLNRCEMSRRLAERNPERPRNPATIKYRLLTLARYEERYGTIPPAGACGAEPTAVTNARG
jgi:transcriptional regulator with XRE-family HTH domain